MQTTYPIGPASSTAYEDAGFAAYTRMDEPKSNGVNVDRVKKVFEEKLPPQKK